MLNLENIDLNRQYTSVQEEVKALKSYVFQLYIELEYRLETMDAEIKALKEKINEEG